MLPALGHLQANIPDVAQWTDYDSVVGGCISRAYRLHGMTVSGDRLTCFAKQNDISFLANFVAESDGLRALSERAKSIECLNIPVPLWCGLADQQAWLLLPWIESASVPIDQERLGRVLAEFHLAGRGTEIGWSQNNFIGSTNQLNTPGESWTDWFAEFRLEPQIRWAHDQQRSSERLEQAVATIIARLPDLLSGREDVTSLIHGDLWSGNVMQDTGGNIVLIDPAVYRGCREAEFGMLCLFGGVGPKFFESYQSVWPMPDGWQRRADVYQLYHLLNHVNLFGGYGGQCEDIVHRILGG